MSYVNVHTMHIKTLQLRKVFHVYFISMCIWVGINDKLCGFLLSSGIISPTISNHTQKPSMSKIFAQALARIAQFVPDVVECIFLKLFLGYIASRLKFPYEVVRYFYSNFIQGFLCCCYFYLVVVSSVCFAIPCNMPFLWASDSALAFAADGRQLLRPEILVLELLNISSF